MKPLEIVINTIWGFTLFMTVMIRIGTGQEKIYVILALVWFLLSVFINTNYRKRLKASFDRFERLIDLHNTMKNHRDEIIRELQNKHTALLNENACLERHVEELQERSKVKRKR